VSPWPEIAQSVFLFAVGSKDGIGQGQAYLQFSSILKKAGGYAKSRWKTQRLLRRVSA
jgi:hypothetical protein